MANLNKETKAVLGTAADKIGHYDEGTGGGDPLKKGEHFEVADTPEEAEKMREQNPGTKVRVNQPRNADGTFGYNSQNARKLKYGPSRGTTVPDFLRGVDLLFLEKGTSMVMEGENGIEYYLSTINMTKEQLVENCKHYIESTEGFAGLHEGMMTKKKGRHSKEEMARGQELQEYRRDAANLDKKSAEDHEKFMKEKWNGKKPTGIVASDKKAKLGENTQKEMAEAEAGHEQIEDSLKGMDASDLGSNTWGTTNFNQAGATERDIAGRENWRKTIQENKNKPRFNLSKITKAIQNKTSPVAGAEQTTSSSAPEEPQKQSTGLGDKIDIASVRDILRENDVQGFEDLSDDEIKEMFNDGTLTPEMFGIDMSDGEISEEEEKIAKSMGLEKEEIMA
jgi:hypothetical protein